MSRKKPTVVMVSERINNLLKTKLKKRQLEAHYQLRIQIILLSSEGKTNTEISEHLNTSLPTVRRWRSRWNENWDSIIGLENDHRESKNRDLILTRKLESVLTDGHRSGSSSRISDEEKLRLQALACQKPSDFGLPFSVWTHVELSKQAEKLGITVSSSHFGRFLYTPKHCSWMNQIENWFAILERKVIKNGQFDSVKTLDTDITDFISYYNKVLAKPILWTFSGKCYRNKLTG